MILSTTIDKSLTAEFELNFTNNTWNLPPAMAKWGGVMHSDHGPFEVKDWGVIWLMDGQGYGKKECTVILHAKPSNNGQTMSQDNGTGRAFAPAAGKYKDAEISWRLLRKSNSTELQSQKGSGGLTRVRMKAKEICEQLLPKPGKLTNGKPDPGAKGTGCGEFPGRVMKRLPVGGPLDKNSFSIDIPGTGKLYLTSPTTHWDDLAQAVDQKYNPVRKTWVPFSPGVRPKTGDIYILSQFDNKSKFQHVGMIISSEGSKWVTADGGQGNGWQSGFITRTFYETGQIDGEFGNKAWIKGWVDLDNLRDALREYFPTNL